MSKGNVNPKAIMGSREDDSPGETLQQLEQRQAAAAAAGGAPVVAKLPVRALQTGRVREASSAFNSWAVDADHGVTKDDLLRTDFWVHNAKIFRPRDHVHVDCVDGSFYAHLRVTAVGPKDVKMQMLRFDNLDPVAPDAFEVPHGYNVGWRGTIAKWGVVRGTEIVKEGFEQRSEAVRWLGSYLQSLAR